MAPADRSRLVVERTLEARGELQRAQHPQAVVGERVGVDHAQAAGGEVVAAVERVEVLAGQRIPGDRVDGEVAPARGLGDAHRRIAVDLESGVPTAGFRLAAGQGDVDRAELEHREGAAHRLDAADGGEQSRQRVLGHTEDFEVEVLGMAPEQAIADVAADDQRPAATRPGGLGDRCRQCQRCSGVSGGGRIAHRVIVPRAAMSARISRS